MNQLLSTIQTFFQPIHPLPSGMYHYQAPLEDPRNYRLHLRLNPDGTGILVINASTILHLNQTAAEYAYYMVTNHSIDAAATRMAKRYQVSREKARLDYKDLAEKIQVLIDTPDLDPITFMDLERHLPFTGLISAPYRLDCAITYRLPGSGETQPAPVERVKRELSTMEWKSIINKAWTVGIPQIIFTGGEPTLRDDLAELISQTEANGQVAGLLTDGLRFIDKSYLDILLRTGLDHITMIFQADNENSWKALTNILDADIFVAVHLTLTMTNQDNMSGLLNRLRDTGVKAISLSSDEPSLQNVLQNIRDQAAGLNLELVWNLPVPYSNLHPVAVELKGLNLPEGAGRAWLYVEPDGDVLPSQGINKVLGNMLSDSWESIWKK